MMRGDWTSRSGDEIRTELAGRADVTAVCAANDQMALGVLRAFHERGISVPRDRSVVGFDDIPEAEYLIPDLTSVRQDFDAVGSAGLEQPVGAIETAEPPRRRRTLIEPELIVRSSMSSPPGGVGGGPTEDDGAGRGQRSRPSTGR
jgi:DNA-binding LacI/PurR family transcriptional regulator